MSPGLIYAAAGAALFVLGGAGVLLLRHPLRRILAFNLMGSGAFLVMVGLAQRGGVDPVPQAMVLTGIVVAVAATALALALALARTQAHRPHAEDDGDDRDGGHG